MLNFIHIACDSIVRNMVRKDLIVGNFSDLGFDIDDDVVDKCEYLVSF